MKKTSNKPNNFVISFFLILFAAALIGFIFFGTKVYLIKIILGYICSAGAVFMILFNARLVYRNMKYKKGPSQFPLITTILIVLSFIFLSGYNSKELVEKNRLGGVFIIALIVDIILPILLGAAVRLIEGLFKKKEQ